MAEENVTEKRHYVVKFVHDTFDITRQIYTGPDLGEVDNPEVSSEEVNRKFKAWRMNHPYKNGYFSDAWIGYNTEDPKSIALMSHGHLEIWKYGWGVAAIVVAQTRERAAELLNSALISENLKPTAVPEKFEPYETTVESVWILHDGNY